MSGLSAGKCAIAGCPRRGFREHRVIRFCVSSITRVLMPEQLQAPRRILGKNKQVTLVTAISFRKQ